MTCASRLHGLCSAALSLALLVSACGGGNAEPPPGSADTTPPTVTVSDNVSAPTTTGDVVFTFSFSENVGDSFDSGDISVSGGSKGTLTKVNNTTYTLVVTPAGASGTISVSVAAGSFSDRAGNVNAASASAQQAFGAPPKVQMSLPVSFDADNVDYGVIGFGGAEDSSISADPANAANKVVKVVRAAGAEVFAGTTITAAAQLGFSPRIALNANDTRLSVRVWSPDAGIPVRLKIEDHADGTRSVETETLTTVAGAWHTLTFDFSKPVAGTAALNLGYRYDKVSIFFDFGRSRASAVQKTYYFDDLALVTGDSGPPPGGAGTLLASFDEVPPLTVVGFNGAEGSAVEAGPTDGGSGKALKVLRSGGDVFAGAFVNTAPIPLSATRRTITARVYSPKAGVPMVLKLEGPGGANSGDTPASSAVVAGWQTLSWTFSTIDLSRSYDRIVMLPDLGTIAPATGEAYYFDDLTLAPAASTPPAGTAGLPITFDDATVTYTLTGFGGAEDASVVNDPTGATNRVARVVKSATAELWAGTTLSTGANFSIATLPLGPGSTRMTLRVYAPATGIPVRLKVEDAADPGRSVETEARTTAANAWQTLTFDFANPAAGTAPLNPAFTYDKASVFFNFGTPGSAGGGGTWYFDDLDMAR